MDWKKSKGKTHKEELGRWKGRLWTGSIVVAFIAAAALYLAMLQTEKNMLTQYERGEVYVAACEIPKGQLLTPENREQFLAVEEVEKKLIPDTALQTTEGLEEMVAAVKLDQGVLLTEGMFETLSEVTGEMEEPVIASFKADDLYQLVGGVLRTGDRIHVYGTDEEGSVSLVYEDLFVQAVFDLSGNRIGNEDSSSSVQRVNVYLDAAEVEDFYAALDQKSLRVVKVCE